MSRKVIEARKPVERVAPTSIRLDKFLKISRIIKRRSVANDACSTGHVTVNGKEAKPGTDVRVGDVLGVPLRREVQRIRDPVHRGARGEAGRGGHVPRAVMSVWGIVVAAGRGERAGLGRNKVFFPLRGRSVLSRCVDALAASGQFDGLVLVIAAAAARRRIAN